MATDKTFKQLEVQKHVFVLRLNIKTPENFDLTTYSEQRFNASSHWQQALCDDFYAAQWQYPNYQFAQSQ